MIDYLEQKGPCPPGGAIQTYTILQCWDMWGESTGHRGIHKGWAMRRFGVFLVVSLKKNPIAQNVELSVISAAMTPVSEYCNIKMMS